MFTFRKSAALVLTSVIAASTLLSASAVSTTKSLSSNFTLVNLVDGPNTGQINYVKSDGSQWRPVQDFTLNGLGAQAKYAQYFDEELDAGSGSVVVSTDGPVGAVVQIQARGQTPTSGAYVGVSEGAPSANIPLVSRQGNSLSGKTNSQIIIQNASSQPIDVEVKLINDDDGSVTHTQPFNDIAPNQAVEYDLDTETNLPVGWFGSATVTSLTTGGEVAVVSNFFTGDNGMQTFNAFTNSGQNWVVPLFASHVNNISGNPLSTVVAVQNVSGGEIPANAVSLICKRDPTAPSTEEPNLTRTNTTAIKDTAVYFFNPAPDDAGYPFQWYGACKVQSTFETAMFVQMRFVGGDRAGAYEGILASGTNKRVVVPLIAKRLANSFASSVTIQNLNENAAANVHLEYLGVIDGTSDAGPCTAEFDETIPAGGSIQENHRVPNDAANSVPQIADLCVGTLTVTSSDQPIDAFVQLDFTAQSGDAFMAHTVFTLP